MQEKGGKCALTEKWQAVRPFAIANSLHTVFVDSDGGSRISSSRLYRSPVWLSLGSMQSTNANADARGPETRRSPGEARHERCATRRGKREVKQRRSGDVGAHGGAEGG